MTHIAPLSVTPRPFVSQSSPQQSADHTLTLLGPSAAMAQLWTQVRRLAPYLRTVLLTGEPDCGQEAVARLLLDLSPHRHRNFLCLNSADADARLLRPGAFASFPSNVFLFLEDVSQFSGAAQDLIVRLIRTRRAQSLSVVASTTQDLRSLVSLGRFSGELADLLSAVSVPLPSLRQRAEDLPMLLGQLLSVRAAASGQISPQLSEGFLRAAMNHPWSGNFRELTRVVALLCEDLPEGSLSPDHLSRAVARVQSFAEKPASPPRLVTLETVIQEHIASVLQAFQGNKLRAAETLGISRSTLYRMLDAATVTNAPALPLAS